MRLSHFRRSRRYFIWQNFVRVFLECLWYLISSDCRLSKVSRDVKLTMPIVVPVSHLQNYLIAVNFLQIHDNVPHVMALVKSVVLNLA